MWTAENCARYDRSKLRCASGLTDEEWALAGEEILHTRRGGNKLTVDVREMMNGLLHVLSIGCQRRGVSKDLPPCGMLSSYEISFASSTMRRAWAMLSGLARLCGLPRSSLRLTLRRLVVTWLSVLPLSTRCL